MAVKLPTGNQIIQGTIMTFIAMAIINRTPLKKYVNP